MISEKMESIDCLLRRVMPQVIPCPKSMATDALQMVAVDFFRETGVWSATFQDAIGACESCVRLNPPKVAVIAHVNSVCINGEKLASTGYDVSRDCIELHECPGRESMLVVTGSLRPLRTATELPVDLLEEYGDTLVFGALAKLKAMSGQHVEWADPQGASLNYQLYQDGVSQAKARKFRKRLGGGSLYVNTGDL